MNLVACIQDMQPVDQFVWVSRLPMYYLNAIVSMYVLHVVVECIDWFYVYCNHGILVKVYFRYESVLFLDDVVVELRLCHDEEIKRGSQLDSPSGCGSCLLVDGSSARLSRILTFSLNSAWRCSI